MEKNKTNIRIYYSDTDCGGVVYNANYLKYFEAGRTELFRDYNIELSDYHAKGVVFVVVRVEIDFKFPAKYNDILSVFSELHTFNKKTFTIYNEIFNQHNKLVVKGFTKCACVNENGKLISIPETIFEILKD